MPCLKVLSGICDGLVDLELLDTFPQLVTVTIEEPSRDSDSEEEVPYSVSMAATMELLWGRGVRIVLYVSDRDMYDFCVHSD